MNLSAYPISSGVTRGRVLFRDIDLLTAAGFRIFEPRIGDQYRGTLQKILDACAAYPHQSHHRLALLVEAVTAELAQRTKYGVTK